MSQVTLDVLEERTNALIRMVEQHVEEDTRNFKEAFELIKTVQLLQVKNGQAIAGALILSQLLIGSFLAAWIKGLF